MSTFHYKRGDTLPSIEVQLLDAKGQPYPLSGATIRFFLKPYSAAPDALPKVAGAAVLVDGPTGLVRYDWADGDLDTLGRFRAEWTAEFPGGGIVTFPRPGFDEVRVEENLAVP